MKTQGFFSSIHLRLKQNRLGEVLIQQGRLTPEQLQEALTLQKDSGQSLGQVLKSHNYVSRFDIFAGLFDQAVYRAVVTGFALFIGFSALKPTMAKASPQNAKSQFQQQSMIHKAAYGSHRSLQNKQQVQPKLFGSREVASRDISAFTKWTDILGKLDRVSFAPEKVNRFKGMSLNGKVAAVNEYVNQFRYIEDKNNFGKSDYWATPTEFFARGGDCEDFAIAKYAILKQLGVPESQMRLAIVQDKIKNIPHAILIVYTDNGPMLLDNQIKTTKQASAVTRYKPIYSINSTGWWRHIS